MHCVITVYASLQHTSGRLSDSVARERLMHDKFVCIQGKHQSMQAVRRDSESLVGTCQEIQLMETMHGVMKLQPKLY